MSISFGSVIRSYLVFFLSCSTLRSVISGLSIHKKSVLVTMLIVGLAVGITGCAKPETAPLPPQQRLRMATTTSLYDTGLWGYLEPMFEKKYEVELDVVYAGTGKAIEYGKRGDVDVITVHARDREELFVAEGYGVARVPFAYNYFLIVGPESDPAGLKGLNPEEAFRKLMKTEGSGFVSRGDDSGTHSKEKSIWKNAGYEYEEVQSAGSWYIEVGTGMGPALVMASEKQAYTLTDVGTFLVYRGKLELVPVIEKGDSLLNVYAAIAVSSEIIPGANIDRANDLIDFLTLPEIQELIADYGVEQYNRQLFIPCAGDEPK